MMDQNSKVGALLKNTGVLTVGSFSSKLLIFLLVPFYTGVLTPKEYGLYDLSVSTIQLLVPILSLNIIDSVLRFSLDKKFKIIDIINVCIKYIFCSILIFVLGIVVFDLLDIFPFYHEFYWCIGIYFIAYILNSFFLQLAKGLEEVKVIAISGVIGTIVLVLLCIYFLKFTVLGLLGFYYANIFGQLSQTLSYVLFLPLKSIYGSVSISTNQYVERRMKQYSIPLLLTAIGWWINSSADKYVVSGFCGVAANGLLSISYKIPNILNVIAGIFNQAWQISAIKEFDGENSVYYYSYIFDMVVSLTTISAATLILINQSLSSFIFSKDFFHAWIYVPFLLIGSVFNISSGLIAPMLAAQYKTKPIAVSSAVGLVTNILFNFIGVFLFDVQGVVVATMFSSFLILLIRWYAVRDLVDNKLIKKIAIGWFWISILALFNIYQIGFVVQFMLYCIVILVFKTTIRELLLLVTKKMFYYIKRDR